MHAFVAIKSHPLIIKKHLLKFHTEVLSDIDTDQLSHSEITKKLSRRKICYAIHPSGFMVIYRSADSKQTR
jgi:hypothetical protein